jgi:hypothetical protein
LNLDAWVQTHDLRFTAYITSVLCNRLLFRINYEDKIYIKLIYRCWTRMRVEPARMHVYSSRMRFKSTRLRVILFQTAAGMCRHLRCQNHTHECSNHTQSAKTTPKIPKSHAGCQHHTHDVKITLVRVVLPLFRTLSGIFG